MPSHTPPIYFYLSPKEWPDKVPNSIDESWAMYKGGANSWALNTYLYLKQYNFPCELVNQVPEKGILLAYRTSFPTSFKPHKELLFICMQGDISRHPFAQLHVVQNPQNTLPDSMPRSDRYLFPGKSIHINHWTQPELIPRNPQRGESFENIAYLGRAHNLAPELRSQDWKDSLAALGLNWKIVEEHQEWKDYSEVDAIIAVRSFDMNTYSTKPGTKLYNAWLAGVPAILGNDSAFELERKSNLDYIKATTVEEALEALKRLKQEPELRQAIANNCKQRSEEVKPAALVEKWQSFLTDIAIPAYEQWCGSSRTNQIAFLSGRSLGLKIKQLSGTL
jgi:hypothetical protein